MRSSRESSSDYPKHWHSRKAWERELRRRLDALSDDGFPLNDGLERAESGSGVLAFRGRLSFEHGLILDVSIAFEQRADEIRQVQSGYHAAFTGPHRAILRYDDAHVHPGHPDRLHKHVFAPPGAPEPGIVEWVGRENWPTLFEVVSELRAWWETTGSRAPDGSP